MYKKIVFLFAFYISNLFAQTPQAIKPPTTPKLVIGIVVDQMRYDYIYKYWDKYSAGGFKRLVGEGFFCKNTNYNYMPTYTGPGHASIYTGTTPSQHGIISNSWYNKTTKKMMNCVEDVSVKTVGGVGNARSPINMLTTTVTDELRLSNNKQSKVIGISIKDRSAILPSGHTSSGAYWLANDGSFITSTYYMTELPKWVADFNSKEFAKKYTSQIWNTFLPIETYTESFSDNNIYEGVFTAESKPVFPHNIAALAGGKDGVGIIALTPWGNTILKDLAMAALLGENLGKGKFTDFLCISFSSTDIIGHMYGPQSVEIEDTYIRLDRDLAELLKYIDTWAGKANTLVFLTADHAVAPVPQYLLDNKIPAGLFDEGDIKKKLNEILNVQFGDSNLIESVSNQQLFLNHKLINEKKINKIQLFEVVYSYLMTVNGVATVTSAETFMTTQFTISPLSLIQNGFNAKRSGDIIINFEPGWMDHGKTGTTHGSPYSYDAHVPLIWYGWNIKQGSSISNVDITDIAPTISQFLNISYPNGCTGKPIVGLTK
jgi:predicted AlkP superfamily pyrophosphatase or phosphodiesterase